MFGQQSFHEMLAGLTWLVIPSKLQTSSESKYSWVSYLKLDSPTESLANAQIPSPSIQKMYLKIKSNVCYTSPIIFVFTHI